MILTPLFSIFFFLTQDRKGNEDWWKVQLCSIQWTCTQQNHKSLITFSLSTPQQETCVIYVHNGTNKDVDYLGHKWASVTVTHCYTAACCSLAEGWRQICLSQKREQLKNHTQQNPPSFSFPQSLKFTNNLILLLSKCYSQTNQLTANRMGRVQLWM